ncbi:hypothetical protein GBF38_010364 [Nibea albiflora]|uniref:Uncharacterized protein n=1 Tax=Nibea albiflora TaxID=240163 RepID=A0ACB7F6T7_NIBAL|nr:hypothetical protein GBF38_010364 [Nibea albiflora]
MDGIKRSIDKTNRETEREGERELHLSAGYHPTDTQPAVSFFSTSAVIRSISRKTTNETPSVHFLSTLILISVTVRTLEMSHFGPEAGYTLHELVT